MSKRARARQTDWQNVSEWYDRLVGERGSEFHQKIVLPGAIRLLDPQPGQRALDIACGQGVLCRLLAERGLSVVGVDAARSLIAAAEDRENEIDHQKSRGIPTPERAEDGPTQPRKGSAIEYHVGDARDLSFLPDRSFDAAACLLAIQNIHPINPVFEHAARVLRAGGRLVMVMMHPCFRIPDQSSWGWDEQKKVQYRRVDAYLSPRKTPIVAHPGSRPDVYTWTFHKPLQAYIKSIARAGLAIDALEEWPSHKTSTSGPRAAAENVARNEIPMFLALRAVKP
jgi:ubiquinone/menaquinone biosynthesis C-methylase UbiE